MKSINKWSEFMKMHFPPCKTRVKAESRFNTNTMAAYVKTSKEALVVHFTHRSKTLNAFYEFYADNFFQLQMTG